MSGATRPATAPGRSRAEVLAALAALLADPHPAARAIGRAARAANLEAAAEAGAWVTRIESLRGELEARDDSVVIAYPGSRPRSEAIGRVTHQRSKREPWGRFLYHLVRELRPARCLEMGTCVGVSTSYQAAALAENGTGVIVTLEGSAGLSALARENLTRLGLLERAQLVVGRFRETLAPALDVLETVDYAFVDGHHDEAATLAYFDQIAARLGPGAVVVFDDIAWSDGMSRAWEAIAADPRVVAAVELASVGAVVADSEPAATGRFSRASGRPRFYRLDAVTHLDLADHVGAARHTIRAVVPEHATVLVVSRGDDELLDLPGLEARHFPSDLEGGWVGHHPADDGEAIAFLERARAEGAEFLAFPATSAWWLDHYVELRRHLDERYRQVSCDPACLIWNVRVSDVTATNINTPPYWDEVYRREWETGLVEGGPYSRDYGPMHDLIVDLIPDGVRVLDVACGAGVLCRKIKQARPNADVVGIDFSPYVIRTNRSKDAALGIQYHCVDIRARYPRQRLGLEFDVITMCEIVEHLDEPHAAVAHAMRLLRSGGVFILTCPHDAEVPHPEHVRQWGHDEIYHLLERYTTAVTFHRVPSPRRKWMMAHLVKKAARSRSEPE